MAIWYKLDGGNFGIKEFMDMFHGFHDYRINKVTYIPEKNCLDVFLEYDTRQEGVLLRFTGVVDFHINPNRDFEADWIAGSSLFTTLEGNYLWIDEEGTEDNQEELKKYGSWACAAKVFWAVTDAKGIPIELPSTYLHQTWSILNWETGQYESSEYEFAPSPL